MMTPKELGSIFREAREKRGISIENANRQSRIHPDVISDIENGVYDRLEQLYVRSFIKKYADYLGLDPGDMLDKYKSLSSLSSQGIAEQAREEKGLIGEKQEVEETAEVEELEDANIQEQLSDDVSTGTAQEQEDPQEEETAYEEKPEEESGEDKSMQEEQSDFWSEQDAEDEDKSDGEAAIMDDKEEGFQKPGVVQDVRESEDQYLEEEEETAEEKADMEKVEEAEEDTDQAVEREFEEPEEEETAEDEREETGEEEQAEEAAEEDDLGGFEEADEEEAVEKEPEEQEEEVCEEAGSEGSEEEEEEGPAPEEDEEEHKKTSQRKEYWWEKEDFQGTVESEEAADSEETATEEEGFEEEPEEEDCQEEPEEEEEGPEEEPEEEEEEECEEEREYEDEDQDEPWAEEEEEEQQEEPIEVEEAPKAGFKGYIVYFKDKMSPFVARTGKVLSSSIKRLKEVRFPEVQDRRISVMAVVLLALIIIVLVIVFAGRSSRKDASSRKLPAYTPVAEATKPKAVKAPEVERTIPKNPPVIKEKETYAPVAGKTSSAPLVLTLSARGDVWLKVSDKDNKTVYVGTLHSGDVETLESDGPLVVWTGNGKDLYFNVNGRDVGRVVRGVVRDIKVSQQGIQVGEKWTNRF